MTNASYLPTEARIDEENRKCMNSNTYYWAVSEPIVIDKMLHTLSENLVWETMHGSWSSYDAEPTPRPIFNHQIYCINGREYNGHIDVRTQCSGLLRHDANKDIHQSINRSTKCFEVKLDVISYTVHPASNFDYPDDLDIFHKQSYSQFTMIYSAGQRSGRIITCGGFYSYVPPYLAATDGLIPSVMFEQLLRSPIVIPDITGILDQKKFSQ